jgi:hypothetical protein
VLRRIAEAIDRRPQGYHRRRSILYIAAADFARPLRTRTGAAGTAGVSGWDLSNVAEPAFWSTLLLSLRRRRFAMTLLGQVHLDTAAVPPYAAEKRSAQEVLSATEGIDVDSLVGFVEVAVMRFRPAGTTGAPLVPRDQAQEILRAVLLRGAMVGELRPEAARGAWLASHPESASDPERHWKRAQAHAEELYRSWRGKRKQSPRRLI